MLEVSLRHRFGGFALDVEFTAPARGVTAIFGPSGCGKTTILKAVAGLLRPDAGRVALDGTALLDTALLDTARRVALPAEQRRCGLVFQEARLFPHLSVESNLRYGMRRAPREADGPGFDEVVALLGIEGLLGRRPARLSGGERQRVALGRALLMRPRLLLMDEPLAALDAPRRAEILPFLARMRDAAAMPILYVTHALDEVDALADQMVLMDSGRVLASGGLEALTARTDLPLAARRDAGVLMTARIACHDVSRGLTRLAFPGGDFLVPLQGPPVGTRLRLRLRARDVAVALTRPEDVSVQNILRAVLREIAPTASPHEVFLHLAVGETVMLARVTRDSVARLGLVVGQEVWAMVKSVAFDHARLA